MVEAILNKSTDYTTIEPQPRGDEVSPVTLSVIIPMFDEADGALEQVASSAGFDEVRCSYFNTILFPAIAGIRLIKNRLRHLSANDDALPPWFLNRMLAKIFPSERHLIKCVHFPAGTSLLLTGRQPYD
jgi:hypothetical protein